MNGTVSYLSAGSWPVPGEVPALRGATYAAKLETPAVLSSMHDLSRAGLDSPLSHDPTKPQMLKNVTNIANATNTTKATNALNATNATNTTNAMNATSAMNVTNATNTTNATNATNSTAIKCPGVMHAEQVSHVEASCADPSEQTIVLVKDETCQQRSGPHAFRMPLACAGGMVNFFPFNGLG